MKLILIGVLVWCVNSWGLSKTRGTPLGGMGTGYVKFDARTGDFAASSRIPPGGGDMVCEFPGKMSSSSGFHFFAGGESVKKAKTEKEDAKCPLYTADFGNIKNVNFSLKAFGPFIPGDSELNNKLAASPLAFFEITAKNEGSSAIEVAVALEFTNKSSERNGLLGGEPNALIDKEMGNKSIFFPRAKYNDVPSNPNNEGEAYIIVNCSKDGTIYSAGALGEFLTKGILSNTDGNCVAAKCNIEAGESVRFKFVMAWWRTFVSGIGRYDSSKIDEDNFYYHNFYKNSKEAALFGMEYFDKVRDGVVLMVNRVMGSNFPDWYKDRLLNNTYPLIHNSVWTKDGRVAFWEGGYGILGTLDQGQHAAIWYIYNWPHNQWLELTYWIRNRWRYPNSKNDPTLVGQIHHDFNMGPERGFIPRESAFMAPWDHFDRPDYFWDNDATDWSDLNVMLIFKAYELVIATGKVDSISKWYPQILETATRLYKMAENVKSYLPYLSSSSYDSDHSFIFSEYVSGTAIVAYKAMEEIANMIGDKETAEKYRNIYENARKEYKERFFNESFGTIGGKNRLWQEGNVAGYSWADYFCFEPIMDEDFIKEGCRRIWNKYASQTDERLKVGEWHFYTVDHFGGALTAINLPDSALKLHQIDHKIYYVNLPELVFWQTLFSGNISDERYSSYMTAPCVWRSYFQFMGYLLDNVNKRLWIRPRLPKEMNKKIVNAPLPNPAGWGILNYNEIGDPERKLVQEMEISYDNPVVIREVVLKDNTEVENPVVVIYNNGHRVEIAEIKKEKRYLEKNLRIKLGTPMEIGSGGAKIEVYNSGEYGVIADNLNKNQRKIAIISSRIGRGRKIMFIVNDNGEFRLDLFSLSGSLIFSKKIKAEKEGKCSLVWDGRDNKGNIVKERIGILKLSSKNGNVCKTVFTTN